MKIVIAIFVSFSALVYSKEFRVKKGTILTCPKDNKPVMEVTSDFGYSNKSDFFEPLTSDKLKSLHPYFKIEKNQLMYEPCGSILNVGCIHTKDGWYPKKCNKDIEVSENIFKKYEDIKGNLNLKECSKLKNPKKCLNSLSEFSKEYSCKKKENYKYLKQIFNTKEIQKFIWDYCITRS